MAPVMEKGVADPELARTFRGHHGAVLSVSFSPSSKHKQMASGGADGVLMVWNFKPSLRAFRFLGHKGPVHAIQFSPSGRLLASASADTTLRLWEPTARGQCITMKGHSATVRSVNFSTDERLLITASDDKSVKIWTAMDRKFRCSLQGHSHWVRSAAFSPDGMLAASGGDDKTVKLWDIDARTAISDFREHTNAVTSVCFHPSGTSVAAGSMDKTFTLWDTRSKRTIQHYPAHAKAVNSVAFHPSGNYLLSSSDDTTMKIWDLREGRLLYTLWGHGGPVSQAVFNHDGTFFASGGADQLVMVWKSNLRPPPTAGCIEAAGSEDDEVQHDGGAPAPPTVRRRPATAPSAHRGRVPPASKRPAAPREAPSAHRGSPVRRPGFGSERRREAGRTPENKEVFVLEELVQQQEEGKDGEEEVPREMRMLPEATQGVRRGANNEGPSFGRQREDSIVDYTEVPPSAPPMHVMVGPQPARINVALPEAVAHTLELIVTKQDLMTQTVNLLAERLRLVEDELQGVLASQHRDVGISTSFTVSDGDTSRAQPDAANTTTNT